MLVIMNITVIIVLFQLKVNFLDRFSKNAQILNFIKIRSMGAESLNVDGMTVREKEGIRIDEQS